MKTINCVIVDDDKVSIKLISSLINKTSSLNLVGTYESSIEAAQNMVSQPVELLFLDVEMPEMSGFDLLETLEHKPAIIMVSSKKDYAIDGFKYNITDYLLKPIDDYSRFLSAVNKAIKDIELSKSDHHIDQKDIFIKVDSLLVNFNLSDIEYVEAYGDYVKIHAVGKTHTVYATLKNVESKLPDSQFIRVHRSYIVRLDKIANIDNTNLQVGKKIIPISGTYKPLLLNKINTL